MTTNIRDLPPNPRRDDVRDNVAEVVAASRREPPYVPHNTVCKNPDCPNGNVITIPAFQGEDYCCIDCKKAIGQDVPSVGTFMFVTLEEKRAIDAARRAGKTLVVRRG